MLELEGRGMHQAEDFLPIDCCVKQTAEGQFRVPCLLTGLQEYAVRWVQGFKSIGRIAR